ncbi:hypothetical protein ACFQBQ_12780 [Granulicella cerasi]|uniref:Uncharacterized protein n=1 Tax=Granulicella cerasi TaxID=741063 RepID=A0ABW1ZBQ6_9BACT|nr:hypothetical protein [Granulicella cerasi]
MRLLASFLGLLMLAAALPAQTVGVMPVYDNSLESIGQEFTEGTTLILLQQLESRGVATTLLNPGGVYLPSDNDLIQGYGQGSNTALVLVTQLNQVEFPKGKFKDGFLVVTASLVQSATGSATPLGTFREKIKPEELVVETYHSHWGGATGSRAFVKQPIGKAAQKLAAQVLDAATGNSLMTAARSSMAAAQPVAQPACNGTFRVKFPRTDRVSKSYDLLIDGSEESFKITDGIATLMLKPGEHLLLLHVADPPYKVPMQHQYAFNYVQNCQAPNLIATLDKGGGMVLSSE